MSKKLTKRSEDYSKWYNELVVKADLAENSSVRGCMVIKPYGYAIWEKIQKELDSKFKDTGHYNAYFPLFVPKSLFEAEEKNAEGFAKECAVVTHYRLKNDEDNPGKLKVDENSKLEEELIVRPTSEAIIWRTYKNWIQSYRDLPILMNQWANVVRWEMRTRLFLRTSEFLWQEGHTAHKTKEEATTEALQMLDVYAEFAENAAAVSVVKGTKSANERFAGAICTYSIEAMMKDKKALQAGTSHELGQNFSKAFEIQFSDENNELQFPFQTSWGVSTRLIGMIIMAHGDDKGLNLPPKLAPLQIVIIPIVPKEEQKSSVMEAVERIADQLSEMFRVKVDARENISPGFKFNEWEMKGVPLRIEVGPKDIANSSVVFSRRDGIGGKMNIAFSNIQEEVKNILENIHEVMFENSKTFREENTVHADSKTELIDKLNTHSGFVTVYWDENSKDEDDIKAQTKATLRCYVLDHKEVGDSVNNPGTSGKLAIFSKAY